MQKVFAPMKGLLFVGGYKPDKTVFAVVTEVDDGHRTCHMFKWNAPVCFIKFYQSSHSVIRVVLYRPCQ